jgi:hypothetical protein
MNQTERILIRVKQREQMQKGATQKLLAKVAQRKLVEDTERKAKLSAQAVYYREIAKLFDVCAKLCLKKSKL